MMTVSLQSKEKKENVVNNERLSCVWNSDSDPLLIGISFADIVMTVK